jgi:hypothetical protein
MPPKRRCKGCKDSDVAQRKLDERLDVFLRACDIQAGRNPEGPSAHSPCRSPERDLCMQARASGAGSCGYGYGWVQNDPGVTRANPYCELGPPLWSEMHDI